MLALPLVLASRSPARKTLLTRLGLPFDTLSPDIDETPLPDESPEALVRRLGQQKAETVAGIRPDHLVIASDQVALHRNEILGKPGDTQRACAQLARFSGQSVLFLTSLALYHPHHGMRLHVEPYRVHFRTLTQDEIYAYIDKEQPFECAGSFKMEGLGITLFERLEGDDPTALIGLPLIALSRLLTEFDCHPLRNTQGNS
ncbi:Maf family protein [Larsenimonas suaedae]|uniref:Nucleoside triphosphate pyrophosphatase n=1 Tax=Larsenimonas suaedae TaxID=1851019 RepID=A0ABU1GVH0_9GAMM|nr:Maf family protein [Larsenimonas suaedae]MDR5895825.1 Maf family protein [Larsenimonas suaedae]